MRQLKIELGGYMLDDIGRNGGRFRRFVGLSPHLKTVRGIDQSSDDADLTARLRKAAFEHVANVQLAADPRGVFFRLAGLDGAARGYVIAGYAIEVRRDPARDRI